MWKNTCLILLLVFVMVLPFGMFYVGWYANRPSDEEAKKNKERAVVLMAAESVKESIYAKYEALAEQEYKEFLRGKTDADMLRIGQDIINSFTGRPLEPSSADTASPLSDGH
jgi:sensor histidine kinase regulating citrate/malate metabolism